MIRLDQAPGPINAGRSWIEAAKAHGIVPVAQALGHKTDASGISPCPSCGATVREAGRNRLPVHPTGDGIGWRCHRCRAGGDAITFAAHRAAGGPLSGGKMPLRDVRALLAQHGFCEAADGRTFALRPVPEEKPPEPPKRPPVEEVEALWRECVPVTEDAQVFDYLRDVRGFDPALVVERGYDFVRALPTELAHRLPKWAGTQRANWVQSGHRLVARLWDPSGRAVSLKARRVVRNDDTLRMSPKSLTPHGYEVRGTVLANLYAVEWLSGDAASWWPEGARVSLILEEGEMDALAAILRWVSPDDEAPPAVVGVFGGAWTDDFAKRFPRGTRAAVRVDDDEAGERFATQLADSLKRRGGIEVLRTKKEAV